MPTIAHLQPRFLDGSASGGISGTAIALIVCVGIIPIIALIWVVVWLLFFYGTGRTCCCTRRKRRTVEPETLEQRGSTDTSQEILYEKAVYDLPQRPYTAHTRTESGSSNSSGRLSKPDSNKPTTVVSKTDTRMSMHSFASASNVPNVQEPKRFV
ncbi:Nn.00g029540.m01.CDS01 [Neocucurbitaria sp. VM-36]